MTIDIPDPPAGTVPFVTYFPAALLAEAATVALERLGPPPEGQPAPQGYEAIADILRDDLRTLMLTRRRAAASESVKAALEAANAQADIDLAGLDTLAIEPVVVV